MDIVVVVLTVLIGGMVRVKKTGGLDIDRPPVMQSDGTVQYFDVRSIPVGNNLMLKRETAPFTLILRQLGLIK